MLKANELKTLLAELKDGLNKIYGPRLRGVFLYGSYARGEEKTFSDIDVLIVLDEVPHYAGEVEQTGYLISDLCLKYQAAISRVFTNEQAWKTGSTSFLTNVREDAIAA